MERYEIAARVWSMLTEAAKSRKVLYYSDIDSSNPQMVGKLYLEPIQSYCLLEDLPALTVLVVGRATGRPGMGFIAVESEDIPSETQICFNFDWDEVKKPTPEKLMVAVEKLPSCGIPSARFVTDNQPQFQTTLPNNTKYRGTFLPPSEEGLVKIFSQKSHATIWGKAVKRVTDIPSGSARRVFEIIQNVPGITEIRLGQFGKGKRSSCKAVILNSNTPHVLEGKLFDKEGKKGTMQMFQVRVQVNSHKDRIREDIIIALKKEYLWTE